jgi:phosphoribosylformylglycinamidine cyclo-ligase
VLFQVARYNVNDYVKELKTTIGKELLKVHRCYAPSILPTLKKFNIKGMAHITGGGIKGNLKRVLPGNCDAKILTNSWKIPPIFKLIQKKGNIEDEEMFKVFNMGIGLIIVVSKDETNGILNQFSSLKEVAYHIGEITKGKGEVNLLNL